VQWADRGQLIVTRAAEGAAALRSGHAGESEAGIKGHLEHQSG